MSDGCPANDPRSLTELQRRIDLGESRQAILTELCRDVQPRLVRYVRKRVRSPRDAEDIVQEVFLRMCRSFDAMIGREPVDGWIFLTAQRLVITWYREVAKSAVPADVDDLEYVSAVTLAASIPAAAEEQAEQWVDEVESTLVYLRALTSYGWLNDRDLRILWMTQAEGVPQQELADQLGLTQPRIAQLKGEAIKRVRRSVYLCELLGLVTAAQRERDIRSHLELFDLATSLTAFHRTLLRRAGAMVQRDALGQPFLLPADAESALAGLRDGEASLTALHGAESAYAATIPNPTPRCIEGPECAVHSFPFAAEGNVDD